MMARAEEITKERRRRRTDALAGRRQRLHVDETQLDHAKYTYRFANDTDNRIHSLTVNDDWEVVSDRSGAVKPDAAGDGSTVSLVAGVGDRGAPIKALLLRKPKDLHEQDIAATQRRIDQTEQTLRSGAVPGVKTDGQMYVPQSGISIEGA